MGERRREGTTKRITPEIDNGQIEKSGVAWLSIDGLWAWNRPKDRKEGAPFLHSVQVLPGEKAEPMLERGEKDDSMGKGGMSSQSMIGRRPGGQGGTKENRKGGYLHKEGHIKLT